MNRRPGTARRACRTSIRQWMSSLEGVVVVFEDDVHVVSFEEWRPVLSLIFTGALLVALAIRGSIRWISRDVIRHDQMRTILAIFQRLLEPFGLFARDRFDVIGIQQHDTEVVTDVDDAEGLFGIEVIEDTQVLRRVGSLHLVAAVHFVIADAGQQRNHAAF